MVLSEGKGVGAGKQSSMPSSGWPGQTASFSHFHSCPCRQTNSSIPLWALGQSIRSLWGLGSHGPLPTGSGLQVPALAGLALPLAGDGRRERRGQQGSEKSRLMWFASHLCVIKIPPRAFSQVTCPSPAFAASRCSSPTPQKGCPARLQASTPNPDLYLTLLLKEPQQM